jgi:hypothetical protein
MRRGGMVCEHALCTLVVLLVAIACTLLVADGVLSLLQTLIGRLS